MKSKNTYLGVLVVALLAVTAFFAFKPKAPPSSEPKSENGTPVTDASDDSADEAQDTPAPARNMNHLAPSSGFAAKPAGNSKESYEPVAKNATREELLDKVISLQKQDFDNVRNFLASTMEEIKAQAAEEAAEDGNDAETQEMMNRLETLTKQSLTSMEEEISKAFKEQFSREELAELVALQQDPDYRAVKEGSQLQDFATVKEEYPGFVDSLRESPLSPERDAILREMVAESNLKEVFEKMNQGPANPDGSPSSPADQQYFQEQMKELEKETYNGLAFALRNQPDNVLKSYHEKQQNPVVKKSQQINKEISSRFLETHMKNFMQAMEPPSSGS